MPAKPGPIAKQLKSSAFQRLRFGQSQKTGKQIKILQRTLPSPARQARASKEKLSPPDIHNTCHIHPAPPTLSPFGAFWSATDAQLESATALVQRQSMYLQVEASSTACKSQSQCAIATAALLMLHPHKHWRNRPLAFQRRRWQLANLSSELIMPHLAQIKS